MNSNDEKVYYEYVAKFGDDINSISIKNGLDSDFILKFNSGIDPNNIQIGQVINIPIVFKDDILGMDYFKYKTADNERLSDIAEKFKIAIKDIYDFNNINQDELQLNSVLNIPFHDQIKNVENSSYLIYTIHEGETLSSIASEYGITEDELVNYNKLVNNNCFAGMNIKIPIISDSSEKYFEYIVRQNDDLETIAKNYGYTEAELMIYNDLLTNIVEPGTLIKIPVK